MNTVTTAIFTAIYVLTLVIGGSLSHGYMTEGSGLHPLLVTALCVIATIAYMGVLLLKAPKRVRKTYDATNELTWPKLDA